MYDYAKIYIIIKMNKQQEEEKKIHLLKWNSEHTQANSKSIHKHTLKNRNSWM